MAQHQMAPQGRGPQEAEGGGGGGGGGGGEEEEEEEEEEAEEEEEEEEARVGRKRTAARESPWSVRSASSTKPPLCRRGRERRGGRKNSRSRGADFLLILDMFLVRLVIVPVIGSDKFQQFVTNRAEKPPFLYRCSSRTRLLPSPFWCNERYDGPGSAEFSAAVAVYRRVVGFLVVAQRQIPMVLSFQDERDSSVTVHQQGGRCPRPAGGAGSTGAVLGYGCPLLCPSVLGVETVLEIVEVPQLLFIDVVVQFVDNVR